MVLVGGRAALPQVVRSTIHSLRGASAREKSHCAICRSVAGGSAAPLSTLTRRRVRRQNRGYADDDDDDDDDDMRKFKVRLKADRIQLSLT